MDCSWVGEIYYDFRDIVRNCYKVFRDQQHVFVTESRFKHKKTILGCALTKDFFFFNYSAFYRFPNNFGRERPVTRNFVQDLYTHVKTQIGVLCRTGTRKMKCLIWFKVGTGQQCNCVKEILQISLSVFFFSVTVRKRRSSKTQNRCCRVSVHATDLSDQSSFFNMIRQATFNTHAP